MKEEFPDVLDMHIDAYMENTHTMIPGKINSYNATERKAIVEPLIKLKTIKEVNVDLPVIENVPVIFPSGSSFTLKWDIQPGDGCLIVFSEVGIGNYLYNIENIQVDTEDSSRFDLTDAICIPGLFPFPIAKTMSIPENEISISNGVISINGSSIELNGNSKQFVTYTELNTALQTFITALNATFLTKTNGSGSAGTLTLDISSAQTITIKTGG